MYFYILLIAVTFRGVLSCYIVTSSLTCIKLVEAYKKGILTTADTADTYFTRLVQIHRFGEAILLKVATEST